MTKLVVASLLALSFATGFTCSKNAPEQAAAPVETAAPVEQAQMAVEGAAQAVQGAAATVQDAAQAAAAEMASASK